MIKSLILLLLPILAFGQENYNDVIKPRIYFTEEKIEGKDVDKIVIDEDTIYGKQENKNIDLLYLKASNYESKLILLKYELIATNGKKGYISQWSVPINVYMDPKLPDNVKNKFKKFYSDKSVKNIPNFRLNFTMKKEDANYYISLSEKEVIGYSNNREFSSEEERKKHYLTGLTYKLNADNNKKYYSAYMPINLETANYNNLLLKKLKKLFFQSLGAFRPHRLDDKSSLLHVEYEDQKTISLFDIEILKIHYGHLYEQPVNIESLNQLIKLAKSNYE